MNIGQAAQASGVSAKMIRHYEEMGLVPKPPRTRAGYRVCGENDVHRLRFIRHARSLGFATPEIEQLLSLWGNRRRSSAKVKELALRHIAELDARIAEMQRMKRTLEDLASHCHGDDRPECPILDELASEPTRAR
ncbi:MAG TPA: Cu(I)-responsive transcriptional regulator [Burkholderiales bacterium]|nr:Cu(I)-responsive transcriptional regulator [Burkholderiales bacterium]